MKNIISLTLLFIFFSSTSYAENTKRWVLNTGGQDAACIKLIKYITVDSYLLKDDNNFKGNSSFDALKGKVKNNKVGLNNSYYNLQGKINGNTLQINKITSHVTYKYEKQVVKEFKKNNCKLIFTNASYNSKTNSETSTKNRWCTEPAKIPKNKNNLTLCFSSYDNKKWIEDKNGDPYWKPNHLVFAEPSKYCPGGSIKVSSEQYQIINKTDQPLTDQEIQDLKYCNNDVNDKEIFASSESSTDNSNSGNAISIWDNITETYKTNPCNQSCVDMGICSTANDHGFNTQMEISSNQVTLGYLDGNKFIGTVDDEENIRITNPYYGTLIGEIRTGLYKIVNLSFSNSSSFNTPWGDQYEGCKWKFRTNYKSPLQKMLEEKKDGIVYYNNVTKGCKFGKNYIGLDPTKRLSVDGTKVNIINTTGVNFTGSIRSGKVNLKSDKGTLTGET